MRNEYGEEKEEIYDVLKDNPRWKNNIPKPQKPPKKIRAVPVNHEKKEEKDEKKVTDIPNTTHDKKTSEKPKTTPEKDYAIKPEDGDIPAEEYLNVWKNKDTEKKNKEDFKKQLKERKDPKFTVNSNDSKHIKVILRIIAVILVLLSVYCIVSDVVNHKSNAEHIVQIQTQSKPENATESTETQVAEAVRPSIAEIKSFIDQADYDAQKAVLTGSGIVLSSDGYIVTNAHVLNGASVYSATVNGKTFPAKAVGNDSGSDLAVVKIDASDLTAATLGDSNETQVGEKVLAIGNPAGLDDTVTDGIVSAVNREITSDETGAKMTCIQTNAAVSPGNSGGALVNMYGQIIGIVSSEYKSADYNGIGFAITINSALPIIQNLMKNGSVSTEVNLGLEVSDLSDANVRAKYETTYGFTIPAEVSGLWVTNVDANGSAAQSDIQVGDIITELNGSAINNIADYTNFINQLDTKNITAKYYRYNGETGLVGRTVSFKI